MTNVVHVYTLLYDEEADEYFVHTRIRSFKIVYPSANYWELWEKVDTGYEFKRQAKSLGALLEYLCS